MKYNEVFGLYSQIDLYKMDFIHILMTQINSRLEITKDFLRIVLVHP
jgi:hypothetical protein